MFQNNFFFKVIKKKIPAPANIGTESLAFLS